MSKNYHLQKTQPGSNSGAVVGVKSRNSNFKAPLMPKAWNSVNNNYTGTQVGLPISGLGNAQTFQAGELTYKGQSE